MQCNATRHRTTKPQEDAALPESVRVPDLEGPWQLNAEQCTRCFPLQLTWLGVGRPPDAQLSCCCSTPASSSGRRPTCSIQFWQIHPRPRSLLPYTSTPNSSIYLPVLYCQSIFSDRESHLSAFVVLTEKKNSMIWNRQGRCKFLT